MGRAYIKAMYIYVSRGQLVRAYCLTTWCRVSRSFSRSFSAIAELRVLRKLLRCCAKTWWLLIHTVLHVQVQPLNVFHCVVDVNRKEPISRRRRRRRLHHCRPMASTVTSTTHQKYVKYLGTTTIGVGDGEGGICLSCVSIFEQSGVIRLMFCRTVYDCKMRTTTRNIKFNTEKPEISCDCCCHCTATTSAWVSVFLWGRFHLLSKTDCLSTLIWRWPNSLVCRNLEIPPELPEATG